MLPMCMRLMGWVRNDSARGSFLSLAGGSVLPMQRPVAPMLATVPASRPERRVSWDAIVECVAGRAVTCHAEVAACSENVPSL